MQFGELFVQTARSLLANKLRSFLTMFGIAWGILSIMLMMAVGAGLEKGQQDVALTLGRDILIIHGGVTGLQAGGERAGRRIWIDRNDAELIRANCPSVEHVTPEIGQQALARSAYNSGNLGVSGAWPIFKEIRTQNLARGRFHNDGDEADGRRVAVLGWEVRAQLYGGRDPVGETLYLNGIPYLVIGYLAKKDQDSNYDGPDNSKIFVPFHAAIADFPNKPPRHATNVDDIVATPKSVELHTRADAEIRGVLARKYGFDPQDKDAVSIWDTVESAEMFHKMTSSMQVFLGTVGVITLFLGGIGVMNIMLVSVTERTREIGVRMAVGATRRAILTQFFMEALLLTALSGAIGMGAGFAICRAVTAITPPGSYFAGLIVTPSTVFGAFAVLALVALGSGMYPARRAAFLQPVEALRYEH
jgi:putative ABC transport system permease protein